MQRKILYDSVIYTAEEARENLTDFDNNVNYDVMQADMDLHTWYFLIAHPAHSERRMKIRGQAIAKGRHIVEDKVLDEGKQWEFYRVSFSQRTFFDFDKIFKGRKKWDVERDLHLKKSVAIRTLVRKIQSGER